MSVEQLFWYCLDIRFQNYAYNIQHVLFESSMIINIIKMTFMSIIFDNKIISVHHIYHMSIMCYCFLVNMICLLDTLVSLNWCAIIQKVPRLSLVNVTQKHRLLNSKPFQAKNSDDWRVFLKFKKKKKTKNPKNFW